VENAKSQAEQAEAGRLPVLVCLSRLERRGFRKGCLFAAGITESECGTLRECSIDGITILLIRIRVIIFPSVLEPPELINPGGRTRKPLNVAPQVVQFDAFVAGSAMGGAAGSVGFSTKNTPGQETGDWTHSRW
jgi:hypothetical protein